MFVPLRTECALTWNQMARQMMSPLCTFYAYCLMSNHMHLLIQERDEPLSDVIKRIGVSYAHYFNKKYERNGHLFQDRFRSEPVDSIEYFVVLLRYIHQNPLKAGIVERTEYYHWSSWKEYENKNCHDSLCSTHAVFSRIPREDLRELVCVPVEGYGQILDIDAEGIKAVSDGDVKAFLHDYTVHLRDLRNQREIKTNYGVALADCTDDADFVSRCLFLCHITIIK